ncbi:MAG: alpha/beta hydrolase, partial [Alphaproteobacteria bacterium]|nr:alpha/beta hydrolase [Alphaproteobacteria bacterium]
MYVEEPLVLGAHGNLIGILATPDGAAADLAVILLNAGLIHHVGPGRLYVDIARRFADGGVATLRMDFSGVGDSLPRPDNLPVLELAAREPCEAMDALARRGYRRFVMLGICSGAYAAFKA